MKPSTYAGSNNDETGCARTATTCGTFRRLTTQSSRMKIENVTRTRMTVMTCLLFYTVPIGHVRSHLVDFSSFYLLCLQTVVGVGKCGMGAVVENINMPFCGVLLNFSVSFNFTGLVDFATCL